MKFQLLDALSNWLKATELSGAITGYSWIWPLCETLHFVGMAFLVGTVCVLDLRMLGVAKQLRFEGLHSLTRWGIAGFVVNLITGVIFFIGAPFQYVHNGIFQLKLLFILLAGINALVFEFRILPRMRGLDDGADAPSMAKMTAFFSLVLWLCVMFFGRMLPFLGEAF
jgi:hypothetical protein